MKNTLLYILSFVLLAFAGCKEDDFPVPQSREVSANFSFSFSPNDYAPSTITFTSTTVVGENAGTVSYLWNFGDGTTGTGATVNHEYDTPGDYQVTLVVESDNDLDFARKTVTIRDATALLVEVFFLDAGSETINNLDGTSFAVEGFGTGLAYDPVNEKLYFTDDDDGTLKRADVDGANLETVAGDFSAPRGVAIDAANQVAYVVDRGVNAVIAVNMGTGDKTTLYNTASNGLGELPEAIAYHDGFVYVTCVEIDAEAVWKGNVNGSGITRIIDYNAGGYGYGIAVDAGNGKIYFDDTDTGQILRANLDGSEVEPVINTNNRAYGIAIDNTNEKMYWTERNSGNVYMANLDGSGKVTIGAGYIDPRGLAFRE